MEQVARIPFRYEVIVHIPASVIGKLFSEHSFQNDIEMHFCTFCIRTDDQNKRSSYEVIHLFEQLNLTHSNDDDIHLDLIFVKH